VHLPSSTPKHPQPERGLLITPLRQFLSGDAGNTIKSSFQVANLTPGLLEVNFLVKQFSVTDYTYNYTFESPSNDWLQLSKTSAIFRPNQTITVDYTIAIPPGSAPGGRYYTLFASADLSSGGVRSVVQATDLVYLTVNGKLNTVSHLQDSSIQWLSFGHTIPFKLEPINTGNTHAFIYVSGQLHGLFVKPARTSGSHLLMPGKVRTFSSDIPSPVLPGIYNASYGYKTDAGWVIQQTHLVVFIPPWSIAFVLALALIGGKFIVRKRAKSANEQVDTET
jgi:hypothetical protein